jgi:hypothetical protein
MQPFLGADGTHGSLRAACTNKTTAELERIAAGIPLNAVR